MEHDYRWGRKMTSKHETLPDKGFWRSVRSTGFIMGVGLAAAMTSVPAQANNGFDDAHSLRSLDIMLMVTALRCRSSEHDFQSDYHAFSAAHITKLKAASRTLKRSFAASYGERNPNRALDRMGVKIANAYGGGHPWMSCAELQQEARELSRSADVASLARRARTLLSATRPPVTAAPRVAQNDGVRIGYNMTAEWKKRP